MKVIDMHCHILPGVDDGAQNQEETIQMLRLMKEQGVVGMIVTPHYRVGMFEPESSKVLTRCKWTWSVAKEQRMHIWLGSECYIYDGILQNLQDKKCNTMAGSDYVLTEFSSLHSYSTIRKYINDFLMEGYIPIIAHVERIPALEGQHTKIRQLRELGAKIQVNAESILGMSGNKAKRDMWKLIRLDLIDYIASDSHNLSTRKPNLGTCYQLVVKKVGEEYANKVFYYNQRKIIYNERE